MDEIAVLLSSPSLVETTREQLRAALARTTQTMEGREGMPLLAGAAALVVRESASRVIAIADFLRATAPVVPEEAIRALVHALRQADALTVELCAPIRLEILLLGSAERQEALTTWADEMAMAPDPALLRDLYAYCAWYAQTRAGCGWIVESLSNSMTGRRLAAETDDRCMRTVLAALASLRESTWAGFESTLLIDAVVGDRTGWIGRALRLADAATLDHFSQVLSACPASGADASLTVLAHLLADSDAPHRIRYPRADERRALDRDFGNWLRMVPDDSLDALRDEVVGAIGGHPPQTVALCLGALAERAEGRALLAAFLKVADGLTVAQLRAGLVPVLEGRKALIPVAIEWAAGLAEDRRGACAVAVVDSFLYPSASDVDYEDRMQMARTCIELALDKFPEGSRVALFAAFSHRVWDHLGELPLHVPASGTHAQTIGQGVRLGTSFWTGLHKVPDSLRREAATLQSLREVLLLPPACNDPQQPCTGELAQLLRLEFPESDAALKDPLLRSLALSFPQVMRSRAGFRAVHALMLRGLMAPDGREGKSREGPGPASAQRASGQIEELYASYDALGAMDRTEAQAGKDARLEALGIARDQVRAADRLRPDATADLLEAIARAEVALSAKRAPAGAAAPEKPARTQ
ncbi:hypothetical protein [Ramlibacter rhizophilus]|uniref:Uncharacterized protein n=1 Tax=Ramlibacter rhizophilus TaxID=1781167 RepID=A0A4Z0C329_9BURK|nr:hypothetical protein [Ramlibacter rhizophilus]TFZ04880.1 hypothetical protein EZ242_03795 [Ramlibacter rhizophilus]